MGPMGLIILWVYFWRDHSIIFEEWMQAIARSDKSWFLVQFVIFLIANWILIFYPIVRNMCITGYNSGKLYIWA